jgi:hypothetical protein
MKLKRVPVKRTTSSKKPGLCTYKHGRECADVHQHATNLTFGAYGPRSLYKRVTIK